MKEENSVSLATLKRLPLYLQYLVSEMKNGRTQTSAAIIAKNLGLNDVLVRKDIAFVTNSGGRPKTGHQIENLITCIETYLGYNNSSKALLVGVGHLGSALLSYNGFSDYGLEIVVAFDNDEFKINSEINKIKICDISKIKSLSKRLNVHIGIISVNALYAQEIADILVDAGIKAIWNFAPIHLNLSSDIIVQNENMASSLAVLSRRLSEKLEK